MGIVSGRIRKQVYSKCNRKCAYCGMDVAFPAMQVDHLVPCYWKVSDEELAEKGWPRGTDHYSNLMPSCRRCNKWKAEFPLDVFREEITKQHARLKETVNGFRLILDYGIIVEQIWDNKFYFEKMQGFSREAIRITK